MATLGEAFDKIRHDKQLAKNFGQDPEGVMKSLGVDTSRLKISKTGHASAASTADISGCVSIGCVVCASIG